MKGLDFTDSATYICVEFKDAKGRKLVELPNGSFPLTVVVVTERGERRYSLNLYRHSGRFKSMTLT